jgi:imidazolonepropionase
MPSILLKNIKQLIGTTEKPRLKGLEMAHIDSIEKAFLLIENQRIIDFGSMSNCPDSADETLDCTGRLVLPAWCDSHTHLVFAASREEEFVMRLKGASYQEIAEQGGGILNSAKRLQGMDENELYDNSLQRLADARKMGTKTIEIKSGYGLTVDSELKILRVIRRLKEQSDMMIKATFLGAHAIPMAYRNNRGGYIDLLLKEMLPKIAGEGLADYIDVFCEKVAFSVDETAQILEAAATYGLKPKIHTNQFNSMGGIETAIRYKAVSVDHLEVLNKKEITALKKSDTIATLLPTAPFFLNDKHTPPARTLLDNGVAVALATDFNPGTSPSVSMPFVLSLACIRLKMTPEEALNAATLNGAAALELSDKVGSIVRGKWAHLIITKPVPSLSYLPYAFTENWIERVI